MLFHRKSSAFDTQEGVQAGIGDDLVVRKGGSPKRTGEDDDDQAVWSPAIERALTNWNTAKQDDDVPGLKRAARDVIDATAAYFKAGGVPLFAHRPLPPQFVEEEIGKAASLPHSLSGHIIEAFVDKFDEGARPVVVQQIATLLQKKVQRGSENGPQQDRSSEENAGQLGPTVDLLKAATSNNSPLKLSDQNTDIDDHTPDQLKIFSNHNFDDHADLLQQVATKDGRKLQKNASGAQANEPPIVKAYRRYAPSQPGAKDLELEEAQKVAEDANGWIRFVRGKVRNANLSNSPNGFLREFARAVERYYADGSDRSVAAVGTQLSELNVDATDKYAAYVSYYDRIYFTAPFRTANKYEKIITIVHEVLHATTTMKHIAAQSHALNAPKGSVEFAKHEAYVDNAAKAIAKQLGLIPNDYPATDWHNYLRK